MEYRAMDDTGGDRHGALVRVRPPWEVIVKRSIGQWDRAWDPPWNRGCPETKKKKKKKQDWIRLAQQRKEQVQTVM